MRYMANFHWHTFHDCGKYLIIINNVTYKLIREITNTNKIYILNIDIHCYDTIHKKA